MHPDLLNNQAGNTASIWLKGLLITFESTEWKNFSEKRYLSQVWSRAYPKRKWGPEPESESLRSYKQNSVLYEKDNFQENSVSDFPIKK